MDTFRNVPDKQEAQIGLYVELQEPFKNKPAEQDEVQAKQDESVFGLVGEYVPVWHAVQTADDVGVHDPNMYFPALQLSVQLIQDVKLLVVFVNVLVPHAWQIGDVVFVQDPAINLPAKQFTVHGKQVPFPLDVL